MSKLDAYNFLSQIKNLVTGGGRLKDGVMPQQDAGYVVDRPNLVAESILVSGVTYIADSNGFPVLNAAASNTAVAVVPFMVPRDYDEATDTMTLNIVAHMGGATDTPTLTVAGKKQVIGSAPASLVAPTGVSLTTAALSATATLYTIALRGNGLLRNTLVEITITSGAHTTDAIQVLDIHFDYRSTLVSYNETDGVNAEHGNPLR